MPAAATSAASSATRSRPSGRLAGLRQFFGIPESGTPHSEQWAAAIGALLGVAAVALLTHQLLGRSAAVFIVPSLGATAVLVFAAPHSLFAQPWSVVVGNVLSALIGVACYRVLGDTALAAAAAVAIAIAAMHLTRSIHPPGGATALAAVIGGPAIHQLGYAYALAPIAISCLVILVVGILYNAPFAWRRYPASLMRYAATASRTGELAEQPRIRVDEAHVRAAMTKMNVAIDAGVAELTELVRQSLAVAQRNGEGRPTALERGRYYGNDRPGRHWSVRQIVDEQPTDDPEQDVLVYRVVDGRGRHRVGSCTRRDFARWAGRELHPHPRVER